MVGIGEGATVVKSSAIGEAVGDEVAWKVGAADNDIVGGGVGARMESSGDVSEEDDDPSRATGTEDDDPPSRNKDAAIIIIHKTKRHPATPMAILMQRIEGGRKKSRVFWLLEGGVDGGVEGHTDESSVSGSPVTFSSVSEVDAEEDAAEEDPSSIMGAKGAELREQDK